MEAADSSSIPNSPETPKVAIFDWTADEFAVEGRRFLEDSRQPAYRLGQLAKWFYERTPDSFDDMSDLPQALREELEKRFLLHPLVVAEHRHSTDGTEKFLWNRRLGGGNLESVMIPDKSTRKGDRITYCISSQIGCAVKCPFCATGYGGFEGQLSAGEIVDQVLQMRTLTGKAPTNLVFMGMGEPLLNFEAVTRTISILSHAEQIGIGARRITLSTVGIPDRIRELSRQHPQVKIAISLHAARDELRNELVPLNRKYPIRDVIDTVTEVSGITGRMPTMEYVVLPGVNDSERDVDDIVRLLDTLACRVNLIGFNPFDGAPYSKPSVKRLLWFKDHLSKRFRGPVTLRRARGEDIDGACGQLSLRHEA